MEKECLFLVWVEYETNLVFLIRLKEKLELDFLQPFCKNIYTLELFFKYLNVKFI